MADGHGSFCWYELMTTDPVAAVAFYRKVVGWNETAAGSPEAPYTVLLAGDRGVGGALGVPSDAPAGFRPYWAGYILVDDVEAAATSVTKAGGSIHRAPSDIPTIGRFAVAADPQGAVFILFKNFPQATDLPDVPPGEVGHFGWRELMAADGASAFEFYAGQFGWSKTVAHDMGPMGTYQLFTDGAGVGDVGGMATKPAEVPAPFWTYYITVDAIGAAVERVKAGGGAVVMGPHQVPGDSWIIHGLDPQGAMFALVSPNA